MDSKYEGNAMLIFSLVIFARIKSRVWATFNSEAKKVNTGLCPIFTYRSKRDKFVHT